MFKGHELKKGLTEKEILNYSGKKFTSAHVKKLAEQIRNNTTLTELNLRDNRIDDEGAEALADIIGMPHASLRIIHLGNNTISNKGAQALAEAMVTNHTITLLELERNNAITQGEILQQIAKIQRRNYLEQSELSLAINERSSIAPASLYSDRTENTDDSSVSASEARSLNSIIVNEKGKMSVSLSIPFTEIECEINSENLLGYGAFGRVYKGVYRHEQVAIKFITNMNSLEEFKREVSFMAHFRSAYLTSLYGACFESSHYGLVMPYAENGSLDKHLENVQLTNKMRLQIILDITYGLSYLHNYHSDKVLDGVAHGDLKPQNILLVHDFRAKLTDFGCSKMMNVQINQELPPQDIGPETGGTVVWMAPEILNSEPTTKKSDIYSYALLLWALCAYQKTPTQGSKPSEFIQFIIKGGRPDFSEKTPPSIAGLIGRCWQQRAEDRADINEAVQILRENSSQNFDFFESASTPVLSSIIPIEDEQNKKGKEKEPPRMGF